VACIAAVNKAKQQLDSQQVPATNQGNGSKRVLIPKTCAAAATAAAALQSKKQQSTLDLAHTSCAQFPCWQGLPAEDEPATTRSASHVFELLE
jgi:hypothetical protein